MLCTQLLQAYRVGKKLELGVDAAAMLQFNGTRDSRLTPIPNRLRLWGVFCFDTNASFFLRIFTSSGRNALHGTPGAFAPINDISMYRKAIDSGHDLRSRLRLDSALFRWERGSFLLAAGLVNTRHIHSHGYGIMTLPGVGDPLTGFISSHFTRMLALNFLELEHSSSIPAFFLSFRLTDWLQVRTGLTFGNSGYHVFIRNTGLVEFLISPGSGKEGLRIAVIIGASDADESGTHQLTPAAGVNCLLPAGIPGLSLFFGYSRAEGENAVSILFGSFLWHFQAGLIWSTVGGSMGAGYSAARHYSSRTPESLWELFWKLPLAPWLEFTPDLQLIHHPAGSTMDGKAWAVVAGLRVVLFF